MCPPHHGPKSPALGLRLLHHEHHLRPELHSERHQLGRFSPIRQHATHHVALGRAASFTRVVFLQKGQVPRSARVANAVALQA